jgi:serine/threonine protein kinase
MEKRRADTIKDMVKNEVDIMKKISHASSLIPRLDISCEYLTDPKDHIVQFVDYTESPSPLLVMEYVKGGRLGNPYNLSRKNMITVLDQILRALQYLHDDMNLAHRDIKPNNILIASRSPFWVKLADFGLAVDADKLKGFCGTRIYAAPEVYTDRTYTTAVDIWSLGVIVYEHLFGLPGLKPKQNWTRWCRDLTDNVEWSLLNDSLVEFLGSAMLLVEPGERKSARGCLDMVDGLGNSSRLSLTSSGWLGGTDS